MSQDISILIVDDTPKNLQVLGNLLKQRDYSVEFALNGTIALDWVKKKKFDLILLDIMMPGIDGYEVANQLKSNPNTKPIPIIFLTAKNDEESIIKGFQSGGVDYLTKPFNHEELLVRITTHLELKFAKDEIEAQNKSIKESMEYANIIQRALLTESEFEKCFPDSFIHYKPRDIVSGDFYWVTEIKNYKIVAVADCTGHGVPGAMMSMLGISILNDLKIVNETDNPAQILDLLRNKLKTLLSLNNQKRNDGMDIGILAYHKDSMTVQFSGALSNLYILRDEEIIVRKGDSQPVGNFVNESNFTNHVIDVFKGDRVYMASDGVRDQFGGPKGKKLMPKGFKNMLFSTQDSSMKKQGKNIEAFMQDWKGDYDQVDDIVLVGIQL